MVRSQEYYPSGEAGVPRCLPTGNMPPPLGPSSRTTMAANPLHRKSARGCVACHSKGGAMGSEAEGASESAVLRVFEQLCGVNSNDTVGPTNAGSAHNRKSQTLQEVTPLRNVLSTRPGGADRPVQRGDR